MAGKRTLLQHDPTGSDNEAKSEQQHGAENEGITGGTGLVSVHDDTSRKDGAVATVSPSSKRKESKAKGHGHKKHHAKKRPPTTGSDVLGAIPKVKEGSPQRAAVETQVHRYEDPFEEIAQPIFRKADSDNDGYLATHEFWRVTESFTTCSLMCLVFMTGFMFAVRFSGLSN